MKAAERLAFFERLVREHSDLAVQEFDRISRKMDALEEHLTILQKVVAQGAQMDFPWFHIRGDVTRHKGNQVARVWMHMKQNPECRLYPAVVAPFSPDPLGYEKLEGLYSACIRYHVEDFLGC